MTIGDNRAPIDVAIQDQSTEIVDLHLTRLIDTAALNAPVAIDDVTANIEVLTTPVVGDVLSARDVDGVAFYQAEIISVSAPVGDAYDVGVDMPFDFPFGIADQVELRSADLAVDGSVTPLKFTVSPSGLADGVEWDITRFTGTMLGIGAMGDGLFGDLAALSKGIVIRVENGVTKNVFNAKTNGQIKEHSFDLAYADKPPAGLFGMGFRRTFAGQSKNGVVIRLTADSDDGFVLIVQDDLSGLVRFSGVAQGHVTE